MSANTQEITTAIDLAFTDVWVKFISYIPEIVVAIIIFIVGWLIAMALGSLIERIISYTRIDNLLRRTGIPGKMHIREFSLSYIIGKIVEFFIIIVTLAIIADTLNLPQITDFLNKILLYIPNVFVAAIILALGVVTGNIVYSILTDVLATSTQADKIASLGKYAIIIFSIIISLDQLGIAPELIRIFFGGVMLALVLAFGLGGRYAASRLINKALNTKGEEKK